MLANGMISELYKYNKNRFFFFKLTKQNFQKDVLLNPRKINNNNKSSVYKPSVEDLQRRNQIVQVNHVDVNCKESKFQMTPLMIASLQGSKDILIYLIYHGANINLRDVKGYNIMSNYSLGQLYFYLFLKEIQLFN
jgi:hypothetical protein